MSSRLPNIRINTIFRALGILAATGIALLLLQSFGQPGWSADSRYLFVGGLAAIVGIGVGGLLGLIFGLPQSVVAMAVPTADKGTTGMPVSTGDWYNDSSTLEKIAGAATAAIIALSLANYDKIVDRFDTTAIAVGTAMQSSAGSALDTALAQARNARAASKVAKQTGESATDFDARQKSAAAAMVVAQDTVARATSDAEVPGALLLGGYAVLGFAAAYLWTRRYLPAELANARLAQRGVVRQDAEDQAALDQARANKLEQTTPKADADPAALTDAVAKAQDPATTARSFAPDVELIQPGAVQDDPWKGQFGGKAVNDQAQMSASVRAMTSPRGLFLVRLTISGRDAESCTALAGQTARLYLHPTFPSPVIRPLTFDSSGSIELTLVAFGAFTVGLQLLPSSDLLELDLSSLRDAPAAFRLN